MKKITVKTNTINDEPLIEAIFYANHPCEIDFITEPRLISLFIEHPIIGAVFTEGNPDFDLTKEKPDLNPIRKDPRIFLSNRYNQQETDFLEYKNENYSMQYLEQIANCKVFISNNQESLDIAKAIGVRKFSKDQINEPLYPDYIHNGNQVGFIEEFALQYCKGEGLDIGGGNWKLKGAKSVDKDNRGLLMRSKDLNFIFSSHCLEHIPNWQEELKLWSQKLKPDGILFLYLPHPDMKIWRKGHPMVNGWHLWIPEPITLAKWINEHLPMEVINYSANPDDHWSFHIVARRLPS